MLAVSQSCCCPWSPLARHCLDRGYHRSVHIKGTPPTPPADPNHYKYSGVTTLTILALLFGIA